MSKKLSAIATNAVDVNSTIVGVQDVSGTFSDKRYTITALITYLKSFFISNDPSSVPTVTPGAGAGVGGTVSILRGNDTSFTVVVHAGTGATTNDAIADFTYGTAKSIQPNVSWSPADVNSLAVTGTNQAVFAFSVNANTCRLHSGNTGLSNGVSYIFVINSI